MPMENVVEKSCHPHLCAWLAEMVPLVLSARSTWKTGRMRSAGPTQLRPNRR